MAQLIDGFQICSAGVNSCLRAKISIVFGSARATNARAAIHAQPTRFGVAFEPLKPSIACQNAMVDVRLEARNGTQAMTTKTSVSARASKKGSLSWSSAKHD